MKAINIITILTLLFSCHSKKENNEIVNLDSEQIKLGEIVHDTLSAEQLLKIKHIQSTFQEVYPVTLEETIINFKRDQNPDNEIAIWLDMSSAYENYLKSQTSNVDLTKKQEVFKLLLSRSMMPSNEAILNSELKVLDESEANKVLSFYTESPKPIKVYNNN
ncbi:hypothetical protein [Chryseobacterium sp. CFBP8996]|uniref:hypothetical protein n=1 Tax=Chryseobacterium sp. CFBP8996 TaxID=3096529 RepID=UPI002A69E457|nr:hypothetical protein [Chryseobacterium sp. CFBP8996]MDY0930308.1 hypothetical protein [Chryseobacterium sp. CFBP8996]